MTHDGDRGNNGRSLGDDEDGEGIDEEVTGIRRTVTKVKFQSVFT